MKPLPPPKKRTCTCAKASWEIITHSQAENHGDSQSYLSQLFYLGTFHPNDATCQTLMDQQAKLAVKINPTVMLILKTHKARANIRTVDCGYVKDAEGTMLTSSRVGMIFRRIFPIVSILAFTLRILSGTSLVNKK